MASTASLLVLVLPLLLQAGIEAQPVFTPLTIDGVSYQHMVLNPNKPTDNIVAYYGIPYARQPYGRFRFTKPEPMSKMREWNLSEEERRTYYTFPQLKRKSCPMIDPFTGKFDLSNSAEDCLRVDLYVRSAVFESSDYGKKFGVSVLLEGLDFKAGVANQLNPLKGAFGAQNDVGLLAVVHYRLGALGFLTTEDNEGPANLGLWDQQEALRFIREKVIPLMPKLDDKKVSLLGFGSGGVSASLHLLNKASRPLFSSALISGGSALGPDANVLYARDRALEFGRYVGCTQTNTRKLINCLRNVEPVQRLVEAAAEPRFLFGPVVDRNFSNEPFIGDHPEQLMRSEDFVNMRALYGFPENAGSYRYCSQKPQNGSTPLLVKYGDTLENRIRFFLSPYEKYGDTTRALAAAVKFVYFRNYTDEAVMNNQTLFDSLMVHALTDHLSLSPVVTAARIHADRRNSSGVYIYYRAAEEELPTLSSRIPCLSGLMVKGATSMDDMLQFVGVENVPAGDSQLETNLKTFWTQACSNLFANPDAPFSDIAGVGAFSRDPNRLWYISVIGRNSAQRMSTPYREPNRVFWSSFMPSVRTILDEISLKSRDRRIEATNYRHATIGTGVSLGIFVILSVVLAFFAYRAVRPNSGALASVQFTKVATREA